MDDTIEIEILDFELQDDDGGKKSLKAKTSVRLGPIKIKHFRIYQGLADDRPIVKAPSFRTPDAFGGFRWSPLVVFQDKNLWLTITKAVLDEYNKKLSLVAGKSP